MNLKALHRWFGYRTRKNNASFFYDFIDASFKWIERTENKNIARSFGLWEINQKTGGYMHWISDAGDGGTATLMEALVESIQGQRNLQR